MAPNTAYGNCGYGDAHKAGVALWSRARSAGRTVPKYVPLPVQNLPRPFPAVSPGRRVPDCRLSIKVPDTHENGTRMRHSPRQVSPPANGRVIAAAELLLACFGGAPRRTWQDAITCVGEIDRRSQRYLRNVLRSPPRYARNVIPNQPRSHRPTQDLGKRKTEINTS